MQTYTTPHGNFEAGDIIWHVGPHGTRTRAGTIRDLGPSFGIRFHDTHGIHLVPSGEVRHPGSKVPTRAEVIREAIDRRRQDHLVILINPGAGPMPAPFPKVHQNRERAVAEAERLAKLHPGTVFRVFAAVSEAHAVATATVKRLAD